MNFKKILFLLVLCLIPIVKINAASFSVSSSSRNVTVGSTVTVYINGSDVTGKVNISSSNASVLSSSQNSIWIEPSGSVTFKANKVGSATITVTSSSLADGAGNDVNLGSKSVTINVVNKSTSSGGNNVNKNTGTQKSSNNSLSSLSVEGASLNPDFESGTTEYSLTVKEGTETINVSATPQDSKSSVNGTGNIKVSNGLNVIKVVVTAENGYEKTYLLNVTVEENPIIIEMDKEMYIIDQHAAHERILYEKVKENYYGNGPKDSQLMLLPDIINLNNKEMGIFKDNKEMFEKAGFMVEEFGDNTIKLTGVPEFCMDLDTKEIFLETLDEINTVARTAKQELEDKFLATIACKAAVKAHMILNKEEVDSLMEELLKLPNPFSCPHGRPTVIKMSKTDIEKKFSRR